MRGVRRRENGSWVVERVIDGKRRPKTVKTRKEAVRLKNADKARRRAEERASRSKPALPQPRLRRLPDVLQLENGDWVVIVDGQLVTEAVAPKGEDRNGAWTLREAFEAAFQTPKREGGFLGQKGRMVETHADTIKTYFGEDFSIENIRRATEADNPNTPTLDGLVMVLQAAQELELGPNKDRSISRMLGTLRKTLKLAIAKGRLAALPEFPVPADEMTSEVRYSSDDGCFRDIWRSLGLRADPNFAVQLASRPARGQSIGAVIALLMNINERLKRVEKALARR